MESCARHPGTRTGNRCGRCGAPACSMCLFGDFLCRPCYTSKPGGKRRWPGHVLTTALVVLSLPAIVPALAFLILSHHRLGKLGMALFLGVCLFAFLPAIWFVQRTFHLTPEGGWTIGFVAFCASVVLCVRVAALRRAD